MAYDYQKLLHWKQAVCGTVSSLRRE